MSVLPIIQTEQDLLRMPTKPGWQLVDTVPISIADASERTTKLPEGIPIVEGMSLAIMGAKFFEALSLLSANAPTDEIGAIEAFYKRARPTEAGGRILPMRDRTIRNLRQRLGSVAAITFNTEISKCGGKEITSIASACLTVLASSIETPLDQRLIPVLIAERVRKSARGYDDALALSAKRLRMSQTDLEDRAKRWFDTLVEEGPFTGSMSPHTPEFQGDEKTTLFQHRSRLLHKLFSLSRSREMTLRLPSQSEIRTLTFTRPSDRSLKPIAEKWSLPSPTPTTSAQENDAYERLMDAYDRLMDARLSLELDAEKVRAMLLNDEPFKR